MASGFTIGAQATAAPAFGSTTLTFGSSAPNQPMPTGLAFGSTPAAPGATSSLFGTPASAPAATTTPLFGSLAPSTGLFGSTATTSATPNLPFGANSSLSFGPTTANTTGITFGTPASSAAPAPTFGLGGAQPSTSLPTLAASLGAPVTSTTPSFGFGLPTTTSTGLKLGVTPATTTNTGLNFGLGGLLPSTSASTNLGPPTTSTQSVGLGGISNSTQSKGSAVTTQKDVPLKDQPLPNEILQTVESFKEMVKQQKVHSSEISRCSVRDFRRVEQEIDQISRQLNEMENQLQKNRQLAEKLKYDTAKTVQNVEMAQRTHDTPPGLQYENTAPMKFFLNLADQFERDMQNLKTQIEAADKYVKNHKNPDSLTPQDLAIGMRRLHEAFVALAGRLHTVHSQVESQKETYLNIRKRLLQDTSNPFDKLTKAPEFYVSSVRKAFIHSPPKVATGPTPFNNLALRTLSAGTPQQHSTAPPAYPGPSTSTTGTGFASSGFGAPIGGTQPSNTSLFGTTNFGQSSFNNSFQLQKPPTGNKRGKM